MLLVWIATVASAEPPWQYPWPNDKDAANDDDWRVSGNSYGCGGHLALGPASINNPGGWDGKAIDFAKFPGTTFNSLIAAAADGVVAKKVSMSSGFGRYVILDHGGFYTMYAHLESIGGWVDVGDRVRAGKDFAKAGYSGLEEPSDTHLHFQTGRGSDSAINAWAPESMTGIRSSNSDYAGWDNFGQWGECGASSPYWFSAAPLSDVVIYDWFSTDTSTRFANGLGDWRGNQQASTDACCYDVYPGFFGKPTSGNYDEASDLLFYYPSSTTDQWQVWLRRPDNDAWLIVDGDDPGQPTFMTGAEVHTGDFDGNGRTDLLLYDPDYSPTEAKFQTWLSDGDGSWTLGASNTWTGGDGFDLSTGYFNDDLLTDIIQHDPGGPDWVVREANGAGAFNTMATGTFGGCACEVFTGQFTSDRYTDLYRYNPTNGNWGVEAADGDGTWTHLSNGQWGAPGSDQFIGYFNDDRLHDLLRYNASNGSWTTKPADGQGGWGSASGSFSAGRVIYPAHLDQDERTDMVLYVPSSGAVGVRFSTGEGEWTSNKCDSGVGSGCTWPTGIDVGHIVTGYFDRDKYAAD